MAGKKKRRSSAPTEEQQPAKRSGSAQGRRAASGGGGGSGGGASSSALAWTADGLTVTLPPDQALVFLGRASLVVQSGEVAVQGAVLTPASGTVELCADERSGGAALVEPGAGVGTVPLAASGAAVFTLTRLQGIGSSSGAALPSTSQQQAQGTAGEARHGLGFEAWLASDPTAPPMPPPLPPLWQQAAAEVAQTLQQQQQQGGSGGGGPAVIVVCGAKKVGKSTFARCLANALLCQHPCVAYLDTDCGQPEFTAPGLVSLTLLTAPALGPPHMHQRSPAAAFFVGDVSPANDPARYLQHVRELFRWHCQHAAAAGAAAAGGGGAAGGASQQQQRQAAALPPVVVNTHGWVKGMGFDVLAEMLQGLPVSHLIQVAASNPKKNLPAGAFWLPDGAAAPVPRQPEPLQWLLPGLGADQGAQPAASETSARSAATAGAPPDAPGGGGGRGRVHAVEQRALQWEALAQQWVDNCGLAAGGRGAVAAAAAVGGGDVGDQLAAAVPFEVSADDVELQVLHSSVPPSQLFYALNGAVVGLCEQPPAEQQQQQQAAEPPSLPCLGLGVVRAADAAARRLFVLTALPADQLERVSVLQLGKLELPASLLQTARAMCPYLALHSLSSAGTGAGAIRSRNNLLRGSQL